MNIEVDYIDSFGVQSLQHYHLSYLGLIKHLAWAGQRYMPTPNKVMRSLGMFLHYRLYLNRSDFDNGRFSEPPLLLSDPTEKANFSNLVGKAVADFLSKKINQSFFTVTYEAEMKARKYMLSGKRPDLIAFSQTSVFALEAKGRTSNSPGDMAVHKAQARSGPIKVNFSVASIAYNLFNNIRCNYHDPYNDNVPYPSESLGIVSRQYYNGLLGFLNQKFFEYTTVTIQDEQFYAIRPRRQFFRTHFRPHDLWADILHFHRPTLYVPANVKELARDGLTNQTKPFFLDSGSNEQYIYIDTDRTGFGFESF